MIAIIVELVCIIAAILLSRKVSINLKAPVLFGLSVACSSALYVLAGQPIIMTFIDTFIPSCLGACIVLFAELEMLYAGLVKNEASRRIREIAYQRGMLRAHNFTEEQIDTALKQEGGK